MSSTDIFIRGSVSKKLDGFGFIRSSDKEYPDDCFFHLGSLVDDNFDELNEGESVEFVRVDDGPHPGRSCRFRAVQMRVVRQLEVGAYSLRGGEHDFNEDDFVVDEIVPGIRAIATVADGVSNPPDTGWWASAEAITHLSLGLAQSPLRRDHTALARQLDQRKNQMRSLIDKVQADFKDRQLQMTDNRRQGKSTLSIVLSEHRTFVWASAGDSFILKVDFLGKRNPFYVAGTKQARVSSTVLSAVGDRKAGWNPQVGVGRLGTGEGLLICTDGVLIDKVQRFTGARMSHQDIARKIVEHSIEENGRDDATCVLISWARGRTGAQ